MQPRVRTHKPALIAPAALSIAAWLSLFALEQSPYGQVTGHAAGYGLQVGHGRAQDSGPLALAFFTAGWALMVVAMMVPAVLPFVLQLARSSAQHGGGSRSVVLLLGGYVVAWTTYGVGAHAALQSSLQALAPGASPMIGPAALIVAGAYQLTPLKRRLVQRSCSPPPLAPQSRASRWWPRAVLLGVREGVVCIGCCWALMLLMLVGVAQSSSGMLVLGSVMWIERNTTWGRRLIMPLGLFLIGLGLALGWGSVLRTLPMHEHSM